MRLPPSPPRLTLPATNLPLADQTLLECLDSSFIAPGAVPAGVTSDRNTAMNAIAKAIRRILVRPGDPYAIPTINPSGACQSSFHHAQVRYHSQIDDYQDPLPNLAAFHLHHQSLPANDPIRGYVEQFAGHVPPMERVEVRGDREAGERDQASVNLCAHRRRWFVVRDLTISPQSNYTSIPLGVRYSERQHGRVNWSMSDSDRRLIITTNGQRYQKCFPDSPDWRRQVMATVQHYDYLVHHMTTQLPEGHQTLDIAFRYAMNE